MYYSRILEKEILDSWDHNPVTVVIGPRQCGKSTMVKKLIAARENTLYLDLERPSDLQKLEDPEWFLGTQADKLVCLDEIQRKPDLFPVLRSLVDQSGRKGMYVLLGSASRDLLKQSAESLAGRVSYKRLTPFMWSEISGHYSLESYLSRGGFPPGLLPDEDYVSFEWRQDFITTFLERDLLQFSGFVPQTMRRLWQMLAHYNGQTINYSALSASLGVSNTTIRNYIDLLEGTFMLFQLKPYSGNTKKRIVKSPRIYLSDTGMVTALLQLQDFEQAAGHPGFGSLWETLVLANVYGHFPKLEYSFYRTGHGAEIDIIVRNNKLRVAIECKASVSPGLSRGNYSALNEIQPHFTFIAAPVEKSYHARKGIEVLSVNDLIERINEVFY